MMDITRLSADKLGRPKKSGPEQYAPPDRRAQVSDADRAGGERGRGGDPGVRPARPRAAEQGGRTNVPAPEKLNELTRRVAGASTEEIDQAILELQRVRDMLHSERRTLEWGDGPLCQLKQHLMAGMKVIPKT